MSFLTVDMLGLMAPAFAAGIIVAAMHVPLGQEVLRRGIIFIDLAVAQIAALGVVCGEVLFHVEDGIGSFIWALLFALVSSLSFGWLEKRVPKHQEALIGCTFVLAASIILILLASDPHGGEEVEGLLAGQILWVGWHQVLYTAAIYTAALTAWFIWPLHRRVLFYCLFPLIITLSVQMIGVYLVFASLIMPALGAVTLQEKQQLFAGYAISFAAISAGLIASAVADIPAGPALVCALAVFSMIGVVICIRFKRE